LADPICEFDGDNVVSRSLDRAAEMEVLSSRVHRALAVYIASEAAVLNRAPPT